MSKETKVSKMVRFAYWKLGKPTRLAIPAAIEDAKFAAQAILDAGYSVVQVMEMFHIRDGRKAGNKRKNWI